MAEYCGEREWRQGGLISVARRLEEITLRNHSLDSRDLLETLRQDAQQRSPEVLRLAIRQKLLHREPLGRLRRDRIANTVEGLQHLLIFGRRSGESG